MEETLQETEDVVVTPTDQQLPPKRTKETFKKESETTKAKVVGLLKSIGLMTLASILVAFNANSLISPNNFTVGGMTGIAVMLNKLLHWNIGLCFLLLNAPLLIMALIVLKKKFAIITLYSVVLTSVLTDLKLFKEIIPKFCFETTVAGKFPTGEPIFSGICAGIIMGLAIGLALRSGGCTGGADIIALLIQKKVHSSSIAKMLFIVNSTIIFISMFVYKSSYVGDLAPSDPTYYGLMLFPIIKSVFELFVESKVIDAFSNGFSSAIEFRIITDKPEDMSMALISRLGRGVTKINATGMYTKENHAIILCVINKRQIPALKRIIKDVDPDSFAVMTNVSQVIGLGFYSSED